MNNDQYASAYAIARICGCDKNFDDFKELYDQYYSEIINALPIEKPQPAKAEAISNPFSKGSTV